MPNPLFIITPLISAIEQNALILTPNNRLKNKLLQAYHQRQQQAGKQAWQGPRVFQLQHWLNDEYIRLVETGALSDIKATANDLVRRQLWLDIIASDNQGAELINPLKLATDADTALQTLIRWKLDPSELPDASAIEQQRFSLWSVQFLQHLESKNLQTLDQLQAQVNQHYLNSAAQREQQIICIGFDDITPLTKATFENIADRCDIIDSSQLHVRQDNDSCAQVACKDFTEELRAASLWAKTIIERDARASVGIIAPNLGQCRAQVERAFIESFEPHYLLPESPRYTLPFNFSAGIPLGQTALVHDTLCLLRLNYYQQNTEDLIRLCHSPFWGDGSLPAQTEFLCDLANRIKLELQPQIKTARLRQLTHQLAEKESDKASTENESYFSQWCNETLQSLEISRRRAPQQQSANRWCDYFLEQLELLSWPGNRRLDSNEFQQMQQWFSLLEDFCCFDQLQQPLSLEQALDQLTQLANNQHFQAQTPDSPVQILGALEGSGLAFTHCWVIGMNQKDWPAAPQPNPLLPLEMQRQLAMPHADAERELRYAERLTQGYRRCAAEVIFSYSQQEDGNPLTASALIEDLPQVPLPHSQTDNDLGSYLNALSSQNQPALEWVNCNQGPTLNAFEQEHLAGGSSLFKNQAACPFAAFAVHRLGAKLPIDPSQGFSPIVRGQILHDTLADFWQQVKTQDALKAMSAETERQQLNDLLSAQLLRYQKHLPSTLGHQYLQLEQERQLRLIQGWLQEERERPDFEVQSCEESLNVSFNGLPLTLRLDRLDKTSSGELIVIDYKTGSPKINSWAGERPDEPQLPLYALLYSADIHALMFAEINTKNIAIKGLGSLSEHHDGMVSPQAADKYDFPDTWEAICDHWQHVLSDLADEFIQGQCEPVFKSPLQQRNYTALSAMMRTAEQDQLHQLWLQEAQP